MGALTSNSKRDPLPNSPDFHISKKRRLSFMHQTHSPTPESSKSCHSPISRTNPNKKTVGVFNSIASRISKYPESTSKFRREVHAPCRTPKFGLSRSKDIDCSENKKSFAREMGIYLGKKLDLMKRNALSAIRYVSKDKQLVEVDNKVQKSQKEVASTDSSIEEVEAMEVYGREGRSIVLDHSSRDGVLTNKGDEDNDDVKIVEERSVVTVDRDMGIEHGGTMLDSVGKAGLNIEDVEVYKKLLESVDRRSGRLKELNFNIDLNEKKRSFYQSTRSVKKPAEKDTSEEAFTPLTNEEESEVEYALSRQCRRKVVVSHMNSNIDITGEILSCLQPMQWLNDEVINLYLELLKERERREPKNFLKCHFFNTFFYKKLTSGAARKYDYKAVRRWTTERKLGYFLIDCDKIFVPVHRDIHWCLAIINKKDQKFQYLDSLKGRDREALEFLAKYFVDEVKDKSKKDIDVSNWEREFLEDIPAQRNGYDCGVFMIKYADFYSRDIGLCFSQEHMPYFRTRTAKEILRLRAD